MSIELWSLTRRREFIQNLQNTDPIGQHQIEFQSNVTFYPVYRVDIGFPSYRLANGRTVAAQRELISREQLDVNFFTADPDSEAALQRQHEILQAMVTVGKDAELLNILKQSNQTQPLILDSNGYVINGNRRLCAMRLLVEQDPTEYDRFRHIQVIFLPSCIPNDIDELEARLQWTPDGRSDYSWVDKAIVLKQRQDSGWNLDKIARFYQMTKAKVQTEVAKLEDAELYLEDRGLPGQYSRILRKEYAFDELQKGRRKCVDDEAKKQLFTTVSYVMIDDADATGHRLYESIPAALKFIDDIADQIKEDYPEILANNEDPPNDSSSSGDGLDLLGNDNESPFVQITEFIRESANPDDIRNLVKDKIQEKEREADQRRDATFCIREARKAYTALQNIRTNLNGDSETNGLIESLESIESTSQDIRQSLQNA